MVKLLFADLHTDLTVIKLLFFQMNIVALFSVLNITFDDPLTDYRMLFFLNNKIQISALQQLL